MPTSIVHISKQACATCYVFCWSVLHIMKYFGVIKISTILVEKDTQFIWFIVVLFASLMCFSFQDKVLDLDLDLCDVS